MNSRWNPLILSLSLVASHSVNAFEISDTQVKKVGQGESSLEANSISATDLERAHIWDLTALEWHRYKQLMQGIRGSVSPSTISPIEVLGIHAQGETERQRYAELWAQAMREDVNRTLAFQRAYDAAGKRLYPNEPLIDVNRLPAKSEKTSVFQATDRLLLFVRPECPVCDLLIDRLLKRIDDVNGIDIYLSELPPGDDEAVRVWASSHQIDLEWVRSRRITLNHDGGSLEKLTNGQGEVPYVLRRRGKQLSQVRASDY